jgi:hypothetical protein
MQNHTFILRPDDGMNSSKRAFNSPSVFLLKTPSVRIAVKMCGAFDLIKAKYNSSNREISEV